MKQAGGTALCKAFDWAYARHTNKASWYIRPLWVLPLGYSAWRRSWPGMSLSLAGGVIVGIARWQGIPITLRSR